MATPTAIVAQEDILVLPMPRRMVAQMATTETGAPELHLFYADKEVSFDEPELFAFGETLAVQSRFQAEAATRWGTGYEWATVRPLLEHLIEAGILERADDHSPVDLGGIMVRPSPLPAATCAAARTWAECESITGELTGRPVEVGYLEMIVPVFRVAHIAMDADGRQVGEANVFPRALRLDVPTTWVTCAYPGTRHLSDRPMNVTALKSMRLHWKPMMAALLRIRAAFLRRFPDAAEGWTVGRVERLAILVLSVPTYQLVKEQPVANGDLHPVLSSLFRITDGLRMTMHQMLFVPIGEPTVSPDLAVTSTQIFDYAERNYSFHSETGVCGGPKHMIQEFFSVLIDGRVPKDLDSVVLDAPVEAALSDIEAAFDYGLLGLQVHAALFSLWPAMTRTYEQLADLSDAAVRDGQQGAVTFRDRVRASVAGMKTATYLATEEWRVHRESVYADMFEQSALGLPQADRSFDLPRQLSPVPTAGYATVGAALEDVLRRRLNLSDAGDPHAAAIGQCLMDFFSRQQAIFRTAVAVQQRINTRLGRPAPVRPFQAADADVHNLLQGAAVRRLPYLQDELEDALGIRLTIDASHMDLYDQDSAGMVPVDTCAHAAHI